MHVALLDRGRLEGWPVFGTWELTGSSAQGRSPGNKQPLCVLKRTPSQGLCKGLCWALTGLFPLTPPLKCPLLTPEEADVIGGWEALAALGQFPPLQEGNSSGQSCLSVAPSRAELRNDVAF